MNPILSVHTKDSKTRSSTYFESDNFQHIFQCRPFSPLKISYQRREAYSNSGAKGSTGLKFPSKGLSIMARRTTGLTDNRLDGLDRQLLRKNFLPPKKIFSLMKYLPGVWPRICKRRFSVIQTGTRWHGTRQNISSGVDRLVRPEIFNWNKFFHWEFCSWSRFLRL